MARIEPHPVRIFGVVVIVACIAVAIIYPWVASGAIIGAGLIVAVLVYDIVMSLGQRRAFIKDAERAGYTAYAKELRERKW